MLFLRIFLECAQLIYCRCFVARFANSSVAVRTFWWDCLVGWWIFFVVNVLSYRSTVLKIAKLVLTAVGCAQIQVVAEACQGDTTGVSTVSTALHNQAVLLQKALQIIPNLNSECVTRSTATSSGSVCRFRFRLNFPTYRRPFYLMWRLDKKMSNIS